MINKKCGFIQCDEQSDEELIVSFEGEKTFKSQICANHIYMLMRMSEKEICELINKGEIEGIKE